MVKKDIISTSAGDLELTFIGHGSLLLTFGDKRVYVAGDTENIPEIKALRNIDCAFLPMNLPYTMTPEMVADAAKGFRPKILYPYHYGETDPVRIKERLKDTPEIEVRIRPHAVNSSAGKTLEPTV